MCTVRVALSLTEIAHYRRLVAFLEDAEQLADERCDVELSELVQHARSDLLELCGGEE